MDYLFKVKTHNLYNKVKWVIKWFQKYAIIIMFQLNQQIVPKAIYYIQNLCKYLYCITFKYHPM